jgi:hypothetical protein
VDAALIVVNGLAVAGLLLAWAYFRRFQLDRPPLGAFNRTDVVVMLVALVTVPYLYLFLPAWTAACLLGLGMLSVVAAALRPVLRRRLVRWVAVGGLLTADAALAVTHGAGSKPFLVVNDLLLLIVVVGTATLWAQGGMKARDLALLAGGITIYDIVATTQVSVMAEIAQRLSAIPFVPFFSWGTPSAPLAIGLGDVLVAAVFPLVVRKAFGRTAGRFALGSMLVAIVGLLVGLDLAGTVTLIPAMVVLGPVIVAQIAFWSRRQGTERTTWQYLDAEPLRAAA